MSKTGGESFRTYYNTGTYATPVHTIALEGEVTTDVSISMATRETTDKGDGNFKTSIAGIRTWSVSGTGHVDDSNTAYDKIIDDMLTATQVLSKVIVKTLDSNKFSGDVWQTAFGNTADVAGVADYSYTLEGTGTLTYAAT